MTGNKARYGAASKLRVGRCLALAVLPVSVSILGGGCAAAAGAGVGAVAIGAAIATSECYGYVDVLVMDSLSGGRACDADVYAARGDDVVPFTSCFYAPLTRGHWQLNVTKPGYQAVTSELHINPREGCQRVVHQVSIRLDSLSLPPENYSAPPPPPALEPLPPTMPAVAPRAPSRTTSPDPAPAVAKPQRQEPPPVAAEMPPTQPTPAVPPPPNAPAISDPPAAPSAPAPVTPPADQPLPQPPVPSQPPPTESFPD